MRQRILATAFMLIILAIFAGIALSEKEEIQQLPKPKISGEKYEVTHIVDGDTIDLMMNGKKVRVRLIGVDTPETVKPNTPVEFYGKEASLFTSNLLKGESVYIEREPGMTTDKYGRSLFYIYRAPDGLFVNLEIIRQGYGHAYTVFPFQYMDQFRFYEKRARELEKGLWSRKVEKKLGKKGKL